MRNNSAFNNNISFAQNSTSKQKICLIRKWQNGKSPNLGPKKLQNLTILHHEVSELYIASFYHDANSLDFDPEEHAEDAVDNSENSSVSGDNESQNNAREHYEDVGYMI